jgi:hypothetical protein
VGLDHTWSTKMSGQRNSDQVELVDNENPSHEKEKIEGDVVSNSKNSSLSQFLNRMGILEEESEVQQAPRLSYLELFQRFLWFGARAFGGPFAQIQMMKQELVIDEKWVDLDRFIRVFAVYQALPGPEVSCHFSSCLASVEDPFARPLNSPATSAISHVAELVLSSVDLDLSSPAILECFSCLISTTSMGSKTNMSSPPSTLSRSQPVRWSSVLPSNLANQLS